MCLILEKCRSGGNSLIISVKTGYDNEARHCVLRYQGKEELAMTKDVLLSIKGLQIGENDRMTR